MRGRKTDWPRLLVDLTACFLIPAYTLLFAGSMAWFRTNFSVLAVAGKDSYRGFVLWGILAAAYFFTILLALARTLPRRRGRIAVRTLGSTACLCLAGALLVPYLPDNFPRFAQLHVLLAALACVLLMLALLAVCLACRREELEGWRYHLRDWGGIVFFPASSLPPEAWSPVRWRCFLPSRPPCWPGGCGCCGGGKGNFKDF